MILFSDLWKRTLTAGGLLSFFGLWMWGSHSFPSIFYAGLAGMTAIALYEWWVMARNHAGLLKYCGAGVIVLGFLCFGFVYSTTQLWGVLLIVGIATISDTLAYLGGRLIGGPKLWPRVSPSKTWAGCLTSFFLTPIIAMVLLRMTPIVWGDSLYVMVSALTLAGQIGDLLESAAKRFLNVKDSGTWLPGHGGLLDRLDSILAIAVALCGGLSLIGFLD